MTVPRIEIAPASRTVRALTAALFALTAIAGCAAHPPANLAEPAVAADSAPRENPWLDALLETSETLVVVKKHERTLDLYKGGVLQRRFAVVLGGKPKGPKRFEGDMRTPEGLYRVAGKRPHPRWQYFIAINYPNAEDRFVYDHELQNGGVPEITDQPLGIGGGIGIHGSDQPDAQERGEDWTQGCVAMRNKDLVHVFDTVEVGTPVLVLP
jgi:murein L,D-transpeptidase YafK